MSKFDELKELAEAVPELPWEVTGHTVYALEHDGWRKGVEQMRNHFSFSVQRGPDTPESELQAIAEFCKAANPAAILDLLAIQAQLVEALANIAEPANAGCGCSFPCRCDSEGAEAINAGSMRSEAQEALAAYYAAVAAPHNQQQGE